jgi:transposase-like protein
MARRTREEWRELCSASYASGMTARAFAAAVGVNANTLSWWRWQLRSELAPRSPRFVEVADAPAESLADVRDVVDDQTPDLCVEVGDVRMTFNALPPAGWLADVLSRC